MVNESLSIEVIFDAATEDNNILVMKINLQQ